MIYTRHVVIPVFLVMLLLLGCTGSEPGELRLDESADGTSVSLAVGGELVLALESNPTTGYMWALTGVDEALLKHIEHDYEPDPQPPQVVGGGGTEVWRFRAAAEGTTTLHMAYRRSWEPEQPDRTFSLTVTITP